MIKQMYKFAFILLIFLTTIIAGCSSGESPEERFETYISYWMEDDYSSMYEMLSSDSKVYIAEEEFVNRYENIYSGISSENIAISVNEDEEFVEEDNKVEMPYVFEMDTIVGSMQFDHQAQMVEE